MFWSQGQKLDPPQKVESSHQLLSATPATPSIPVAVSVGAHGGGPLADLHLLGRDLHPDCPVVGAPLPDEDVFQCSRPTAETPQERGPPELSWTKKGKQREPSHTHRDNVEGVQPKDRRESLESCDLGSTPPQFHPLLIHAVKSFFFCSSWVQILQADGSRRPGGGPHGWSQCGEPRGQFS